MNKKNLREITADKYEKLVRGTPYLILLIASTTAVVLAILGGGISGIFAQLFPLLILIGLYLARGGNPTGVKMIKVCAAILFWISCILCGLLLIGAIMLIAGSISTNDSFIMTTGGTLGIIYIVVIVLQFFFPILYYRDIRMIMKDIGGWFAGSQGEISNELPAESRQRFICRLPVLCIIQIVIHGISTISLLSIMGRNNMIASLSGGMADNIFGSFGGAQLIGMLLPGPSILSLLSEAAVVAKFICVILLYKEYREIKFSERKFIPVPDPVPAPAPKPAPSPAPARQRSVRIVLERKQPKPGRFSASMSSELIIGRKEGVSKLVLPDDQAISSRHLKLFIKDNKMYAKDENSHNGTFVNGRKIGSVQQIHNGDEIRMGNSVFTLTWER